MSLLQSDGCTISLGPNLIVSGTVTLPVSGISSPTSFSLGDLSVGADLGPVGSPPAAGGSGFSGLLNALGSLASSANSIVGKLDAIGQQGVLWVGGSVSDACFSSSVDGLLDSVTSDLSNWVASMNGVFNDFNDEVYELTPDGLGRVFPARTAVVEQFGILKSLQKLLRGVTALRGDVVLKIKDYWTQETAAALALAAAGQALRNFGPLLGV